MNEPWFRPRALGTLAPAGTPYLDTGEYLDIECAADSGQAVGDAAADSRWIADLARAKRADEAKVTLRRYLHQAALQYWDEGRPGDSIRLDNWAELLQGCRSGRPIQDRTCGRYVFRPISCDVRLCPDCERARSARMVDRYDDIGAAMTDPKAWTLTLPNVAPGSLKAGLGILLDALVHLRRRSIMAGGPCAGAHPGVAYADTDTGEVHRAGDRLEPCAHQYHSRRLAASGQCRCARCLEVSIERDGYRVTVNGCPRCTHEPVVGGVYSIEVTWSPARPAGHRLGHKEAADWHPHAHLLMDAAWIAFAEMRDAWQEVTCNAIRAAEARAAGSTERPKPCTHPRGFTPTGRCHWDGCGRELTGAQARDIWCSYACRGAHMAELGCRGATIVWVSPLRGEAGTPARVAAIRETLKYVSKGLLDSGGELLPGAGPHELAELLLAIRGRRLVAGWGTFRNVRDDGEEDGPDTVTVYTGEIDRWGVPIAIRMPRVCPICGAQADWSAHSPPVPRLQGQRTAAGILTWSPPEGPT
jgi:hypothetical protein